MDQLLPNDCPRLLSPRPRPPVSTRRSRSAMCAAFGNNSEPQTVGRNDYRVCAGWRGMTLAKWTSYPRFLAAGPRLIQESLSHAALARRARSPFLAKPNRRRGCHHGQSGQALCFRDPDRGANVASDVAPILVITVADQPSREFPVERAFVARRQHT